MGRTEKAAADMRHVGHSIRSILATDKVTYHQLTSHLRQGELQGYRDLCTEMLDLEGNRQWLTRLLVASPHPTKGDSAATRHSSLLAAYEHRGPLPPRAKELAEYRRKYLDGLKKLLRDTEIRQHRNTLEIGVPYDDEGNQLGFLPDIGGVQLIYKLDGLFSLCTMVRESHLQQLSLSLEQRMVAAKAAYNAARQEATETLHSWGLTPSGENHDSLAARLMLSTALNRAELEALEYQRMERLATERLVQLIQVLNTQGIEQIPLHLGDREFGEWLVILFGTDHSLAESQLWRRLKPFHPDRLFTRAQEVVRQINDGRSGVVSVRDKRAALNMSALTLAWSYCTKELHDLRVPMSRPLDLVSGNPEQKQILPTMMLYHSRQLASMLMSQQDIGLSAEKLEAYHEVNQAHHGERTRFLNETLRGVSVSEWSAMSEGLDIAFRELVSQCTEAKTA